MGLPFTEAASLAEDAGLSADHAGPARRQMAATAMINRLIPWEHNCILILLSKILDLNKNGSSLIWLEKNVQEFKGLFSKDLISWKCSLRM
jgi:hypothetical protein